MAPFNLSNLCEKDSIFKRMYTISSGKWLYDTSVLAVTSVVTHKIADKQALVFMIAKLGKGGLLKYLIQLLHEVGMVVQFL